MAHILFVDDDHFTLETYDKIISYFGHQAILADCGERALELAHTQNIDLIVVDRQLPDMDGFELLRQLHANDISSQIPMIMVSASHDVFAQRALEAGAQAYHSKPLLSKDLLNIIAEYTTNS